MRDWITLIGYSSLCIALFPKILLNKSILFLTLYALILFLNALLGHEVFTYTKSIIEFLYLFSAFAIINICLYQKDYNTLFYITFAGLLIAIITSLLTIPIIIHDPNSIRAMVELANEENIKLMQLNQRSGIASYGMIHALPFIFPLMIYQIKQKSNIIQRWIFIFISSIFLFTIIKSSATTPILLSVLGIILGFTLQKKLKSNIIMVSMWILCYILFLGSNSFVNILNSIEPFFRETAVGGKIEEFKNFITYGQVGGQLKGRQDLYSISWNTFLQNPIFGSFHLKDVGGHAFFVDRLANLGFIGIIPLVLSLYFQIQAVYKLLNMEVRLYYSAGITISIFLGISKNITGYEFWLYLLVFLPGLAVFSIYKNPNLGKL